MIGKSPRTHFHVSPSLNLYCSLEVSTGTVIEVYDEDYAKQMKEVFPRRILDKFKELHDGQRFSWRAKSSLFEGISEKRLQESMFLLANEFNDLLNEAFSHYQTHWKKISPNLMYAREALEEQKGELEALLAAISDLLRFPWKVEELHVQLVDPFTGEPIGKDMIALGIGSITSLPSADLATVCYFFVLHEATHILVWDTIRKIPAGCTTEEHAEYIDEAVMNLITGTVMKRSGFWERFLKAMEEAAKLKFPPTSRIEKPSTQEGEICKARHEKRDRYITHYRKLLQADWEELLVRKEPFSKIIENLLKANMPKMGGGIEGFQ